MAEDTGAAENNTVDMKAGSTGRGGAEEGAIAGVRAGDAGRDERARVRRDFLVRYQGASVLVGMNIANGHVRELYRQYYDIISRQYFFAWFYGSFQGQRGNYTAVSREMSKGIQATTDELKRRNAISKALLAENKVKTAGPTGRVGNGFETRVVTPHSKLFLDALMEADELVSNVTALWQACLIDDGQVNHANNDISKLIRNLYLSGKLMANGIRDRSQGRSNRTEAGSIANADKNEKGGAVADRGEDAAHPAVDGELEKKAA